MKGKAVFLGCVGLITYIVAMAVVGSILGGWSTAVLWGWFIVPTFGLPNIGLVQAIGLHLVINSIIVSQVDEQEDEIEDWFPKAIGRAVGAPLASVALGWIVLQFM